MCNPLSAATGCNGKLEWLGTSATYNCFEASLQATKLVIILFTASIKIYKDPCKSMKIIYNHVKIIQNP